MKFFAVALVTTLLSAEAFSQVRPGRGNYDDGRYNDGRYNDGRYNDGRYNDGRYNGGRGTNVATYSCFGPDLFRNNRRLIYRFNGSSRCSLALSQVVQAGKFCDGADMYDLRGNYLKTYRSKAFCHARIHLLGK